MTWQKNKIFQSFNKAHFSYDKYAVLQKKTANEFASYLATYSPPQTILELGCGTGFLTKNITTIFPHISYTASDISPNMLKITENAIKNSNLKTIIMDANNLIINSSYDWIISSLAVQWLKNLRKSLEVMWTKTNLIGFSTLIEGTFKEWEIICNRHNIPIGTINFFSLEQLQKICQFPNAFIDIKTCKKIEKFKNIYYFLKALKQCGANTPKDGYKPNHSISKIIRNSSEIFTVSYNIAYCFIIKRGGG